LVRMKEKAKALVSKNKNELSAARALYVSLDNADNVIEGGAPFGFRARVLTLLVRLLASHPPPFPLQRSPSESILLHPL
jgi:hypothetical protein